MTYAQKLRDPRWRSRRLEIIQRADHACEICCQPETDGQLEVHHCVYVRGREPWEYEDSLLKALCQSCHFTLQVEQEFALYEFGRKLSRMTVGQIRLEAKRLAAENVSEGMQDTKSDSMIESGFREVRP